ncbi:MAG TPA: DUF2624 family protein [Candidatus Angelobacter sp.]|nr:DUF2624 family protein [Candidatus Angelobacter sp.]
MNPLLKVFVNHKLSTMNASELIKFGEKYKITMSKPQASKVVQIIQSDRFDLFNDHIRKNVLTKITNEIDPALSESMDQLFTRFINSQNK